MQKRLAMTGRVSRVARDDELGWTAERERRFEIAEQLAQSIWPWKALAFEVAALRLLCGFGRQVAEASSHAFYWTALQLFGCEACREKTRTFFPGMDWDFSDMDECALYSVVPLTTEEKILGQIVAFAEAIRRIQVPGDFIEDRAIFRAAVIQLALEARKGWIDVAGTARRREGKIVLVDIAPGWFRIEYSANVAALRLALADDGERRQKLRRPRRRA